MKSGVHNLIILICILLICGCSNQSETVLLRHFALDQALDVPNNPILAFDHFESSDGHGSIMIITEQPVLIPLLEVTDINIENARLIYQAKIKAEELEGRAYLQMHCFFSDKGEFFSKDLVSPLTGPTNWTTEETLFFLKEGQNPDAVKLFLMVQGKGKLWIDDINLLKSPLGEV